MFNIENFISDHITFRKESLFAEDMQLHTKTLEKEIQGKRVLVIGGAGTIGASFIKALLPFEPAQLTVVDISENGLTELTRDIRSTHHLYVPQHYMTYPISYADPLFEKIFRKQNGFDIVANFFVQMAHAENLGTGIRNVYRYAKAYAGTDLLYFYEDDIFKAIIPINKTINDFASLPLMGDVPMDSIGGATGGAIGGATGGAMLTERQKQILSLLIAKPTLSYRKIAEQLQINPSAIQKHINELKRLGFLERVGGTKGYWRIKKEVASDEKRDSTLMTRMQRINADLFRRIKKNIN